MNKNPENEYLTTGQAAQLCSVTRDAVLKWIYSGKIPANRTPGGHFRIHRETIRAIVTVESPPVYPRERNEYSFQYCWEFNSKSGEVPEGCLNCIVYRSRATNCFLLNRLAEEDGHSRAFCQNTCEDCEFYRVIHSSRPNVLVVSRKNTLQSAFESRIQDFDYNLEFADCEYQCSMLVEGFQPDFVIIDCSRGPVWSKEIAQHIHDDPRIRYVRIILVGNRKNIPAECDKMILGYIEEPFTVSKFTSLVDGLWEKTNRQALPGHQTTLSGNEEVD